MQIINKKTGRKIDVDESTMKGLQANPLFKNKFIFPQVRGKKVPKPDGVDKNA